MDFIKRNTRPSEPVKEVIPEEVVAKVEEERKALVTPEPETPSPAEPTPETKVEEPVTKVEDTVAQAEALVEDIDKSVREIPEDKEVNFKKLREKLKETNTVIKTKDDELKKVSAKLKAYETGAEMPEVVKGMQKRVAELEPYEKLHALKLSPEYKEKFIKPVEDIRGKLHLMAADYEMPKELMDKALNITNKRELNSFLSENFDAVGALEAQKLINDAQNITSEMKAAEERPVEVLANLQADFKNINEARRAQANSAIAESAKEAWVRSLVQVKEENRIPELILKDNDPEYNKQFVEPVQAKASKEYGQIVKLLAENGLEKLPGDLGFALSRMSQLAHASALASERAARAEAELAEIKSNTQRTTKYLRPAIGGGRGTGSDAPAPQAQTPRDAAKGILNQVLQRRSA